MPQKSIVTGQAIQSGSLAFARSLRREMTPAEAILWQKLKANRLGGFHFRRQQIIDGFIVDFYCHQTRLVVEVDGGIHLDQEDYDRRRDEHLRGRGLNVVRVTNLEINRNLPGVLEVILAACNNAEKAQTE